MFSALLTIVLLGSIGLSCQIPTQPDDKTVGNGFSTIVKVEDESGKAIPGSTVEWAVLGEENALFHTMANVNRFDDGSYTDVIPVPISDDTSFVVFRTTPPNDPQYAGVQKNGNFRLDTVIGFCGNKTFTFNLKKKPVVLANCGVSPSCSDIFLSIEPPTKTADTSCTSTYTNNTGSTLSIADPIGNTVPGVQAVISVNGAKQNFPANVAAGQSFQLCFIYTAGNNPTSGSNSYSVTITGASSTDPNCFTCDFTLRTESNIIVGCDCPKWDSVIEPSKYRATNTVFDSACVGDTKFITVDLSSIRNNSTNEKCYFRFTPIAASQNAEVGFDASFIQPSDNLLAPGASLSTVTIRFSPTQVKEYWQVLQYKVEKQNPDGSFSQCDPLSIVFHGLSDAPGCTIDFAASSLFHKPLGNPVTLTDTLIQPFGDDTSSKEIIIRNTSKGCPVTIDNVQLSGADANVFTASPKTFTIDPGKSQTVRVTFHPDKNDIFPNGVSNPPDTIFNATLTITSQDGCSGQWDIHGKIVPPSPNPNCMLKWDPTINNKVGMFISDKGELSFAQRDNKEELAVYVQQFDNDAAPTQATLAGGTIAGVTFYKVATGVKIDAPGNICDNWLKYAKDCGSGNATTMPVNIGDVIIVTYKGSLCAVMWINDIRLDRNPASGKALPQVCFQMCFPI